MPARQHAAMQNSENQNAPACQAIKHYMFAVLNSAAAQQNVVTFAARLRRLRYPGKAAGQLIEIADRLFGTPNISV